MVYNVTDSPWQVNVVTFRPDPEIRKRLKKRFRSLSSRSNKSLFYQRVFRAGLDAIEKAEAAKEQTGL